MGTLLEISLIIMSVSVAWSQYVFEMGTNPDGSTYSNWKVTFNYNYHPDEEQQRQNNFNNVHNMVTEHNQQYQQQQHNYSMGHNQFSAMSDDEFRMNMMGLQNEQNCENASLSYKPPDQPDIPDNIDYRELGFVTSVRSQGECGACWAFVAIGSLEGQYKRIMGDLVELSEQNLIDCSYEQGNMGCNGGIMCRAFEYATNIKGVNTAKTYPYKGTESDGQCHYDESAAVAPVGGYLNIPKGDEGALKAAVGLIGPVAAGFDGSPSKFRYYKDGIFSDPSCDSEALTHAVTIIGYGTENGTDYWLVKNSWGESWGMGGFGKIARNAGNMCGIASRAVFPVLHQNEDGSPKLDGPAASP